MVLLQLLIAVQIMNISSTLQPEHIDIVVDLGDVVLLPEDGVEDVVQVDGEDVEEPAGPRRVHGVARVVRVCPRVGSVVKIFLWSFANIFHDINNTYQPKLY